MVIDIFYKKYDRYIYHVGNHRNSHFDNNNHHFLFYKISCETINLSQYTIPLNGHEEAIVSQPG